MTRSLRVVYAGTPEFAVPALATLLASEHSVVAVYTQPDRPAGRGRKLRASPVKELALAHQVPVEQPASLRDPEVQQRLREYRPDVMVVAAYGLILPQAVLDLPVYGCLNIHASLLPRWRGAAPIQRAILAGDRETGVTIMRMDAGLDTGGMLLKRGCPIGDRDTAAILHDRLAELGAEALMAIVGRLGSEDLDGETQNEAEATYAAKIDKAEAELNWTLPADQIDRCVRAFNPWPVAYTRYRGEPLRVWVAEVLAQGRPDRAPAGTVIAEGPAGIDVACGEGILRILGLQLPGGRVLAPREFLTARSLLGERLPG